MKQTLIVCLLTTHLIVKSQQNRIELVTRPAGYQARRLNIRDEETGGFVHTINGTACAVPRMIMALVEQVWSLTQHYYVSFIQSSGFYKQHYQGLRLLLFAVALEF